MRILLTFILLLSFTTLPATDSVLTRFKVPSGYTQIAAEAGSFSAWLQNLPLKPAGTPAKTYQGKIAHTDKYTGAIIDMSVGTQDLQQCADAVMRLRAEYLYQKKDYKGISFIL
jgi:hypothetical protein